MTGGIDGSVKIHMLQNNVFESEQLLTKGAQSFRHRNGKINRIIELYTK